MEKSIFSQEYSVFLHLLRKTREQTGLTQAQLATRLGQTQSFVSKCERGQRRLDIVELRAFCNAMNVSPMTFMAQFDLLLQEEANNGERGH